MRGMTADLASALIANTIKTATEMRAYALGIIVLDAGGQIIAFLRQDGASLMRFDIARGKAFACLALNRSSRGVLQKAREKPLFMETLRDIAEGPIFLEAGGQLVRDASGEILGAIGVTGDVNEVDDLCAMGGIRASGLKCDADFSPEECRRLNIKIEPEVKDPRT
jgi:uncharacterized protein GlcG (DUF336 family)